MNAYHGNDAGVGLHHFLIFAMVNKLVREMDRRTAGFGV